LIPLALVRTCNSMAWGDQHSAFLKRIVAAIPEATLAVVCWQAARRSLAGQPPEFYVTGLVTIELLSLAWMRLVVAPMVIGTSHSLFRTLLGIGGTGVALIFLLINGGFAIMMLFFVMVMQPRTFLLLLLALTRRSLWLWAWGIRSPDHALLLRAHAMRAFRAHYLAVLAALVAALALDRFAPQDPRTRQFQWDALWLGGMAGYFAALTLYLLAGRTPIPETTVPAEPRPAGRPVPPDLAGLARQVLSRWQSLLPGIVLLWFVMDVVWGAVAGDARLIAAPLAIALSGWALVGGACRVLGVTDEALWRFSLARAAGFAYGVALLWMLTLLALFLSMPVVYGMLGLEFSGSVGITPAVQALFAVACAGIAFLLIRLWPLTTLCYVVPPELLPAEVPDVFRTAWRLTAGVQSFFLGALPPVLSLAATVAASALSREYPILGRLLVYGLFAPLTALLAVERTWALAQAASIEPGPAPPEP